MQFTEHSLELSIMELFENEGYTHQTGKDIHREKTDVLLPKLLATFCAIGMRRIFLRKVRLFLL